MLSNTQELMNNPLTYSGENDVMDTSYNERIGKYCIVFNARLETFKTWKGFITRRDRLIEKYDLSIIKFTY